MNFRALNSRLVVLPLVALFLALGGGASVAKTCHIDLAAAIQNHIHAQHDHATHGEKANETKTNNLTYQVCLAISFVALLFFRFFRIKVNLNSFQLQKLFRFSDNLFVPQITNYLAPNHIKLSVIRI